MIFFPAASGNQKSRPNRRVVGRSAADLAEPENGTKERKLSPLKKQVADVLRRARRLPIGPGGSDLRQLAKALLWLHRNGMQALEQERAKAISAPDQVNQVIA